MKRTKSGKYSIELTSLDRNDIFANLANFLETESASVMFVKLVKQEEVMRHLYYTTLDQLMHRQDFHLHSGESKKWICTRAEAIALMWSLRHSDSNINLLELKSGLHKQLHS